MTMHRLFDDKAKPYILIDVKTNSEESSCAKKLLYEFLLSMLSHMNYVCIHSDNCLLSWVQVLCVFIELRYHKTIIMLCSWVNFCCCVMLVWVNFCCLFWLSLFRLSACCADNAIHCWRAQEYIFFLSFTFFQLLFHTTSTSTVSLSLSCCIVSALKDILHLSKPDLYHDFCEFYMCLLCDTDTDFRVVLTMMLVTVKTLLH
jgi:hypothetical protein